MEITYEHMSVGHVPHSKSFFGNSADFFPMNILNQTTYYCSKRVKLPALKFHVTKFSYFIVISSQ